MKMRKKIKILIAEHDQNDLEILQFELERSGIDSELKVVQNRQDYASALSFYIPDIILSDFSFPLFDGESALKIRDEMAPDTPFIFVSGTIGEEKAVELIRTGVTDYVLKDKLFTLTHKINRALKEAEEKKEKIITGEKLYTANNLYAFISQVNQNIVRVKDEITLFRNSCQLATESGKFKMAWIGLFDHKNKMVSLVEQSGMQAEDILFFTDRSFQLGGPQDYVIRSEEPFVSNNVQHAPFLAHARSFTVTRGINSCMVLPIKRFGKVIGSLNLYSTSSDFLDKQAITMLREVADDISFALDILENEKQHNLLLEKEILSRKNLEQFASIVSHNLRAPVANILGLANVLKTKLSEADVARTQQFLFVAAEQLDVVFKDLNKILMVRSTINEYKEAFSFSELIGNIKSSLQNLIEKEKVEIITDFSVTDTITSVKPYIHSIFYNLILNGIKYKLPGKSPLIQISSEISKNKIKLRFKDNGRGIDLEKHGAKLFGLYSRFHLNVEGKGLGLFMVKTQIETLGGKIHVESVPGEGAAFIIELPFI